MGLLPAWERLRCSNDYAGSSKVDVFLGRVKVLDLKPTNPVRHRIPLFRRQYDSMATGMSRLLGRQLPSADATYGAGR